MGLTTPGRVDSSGQTTRVAGKNRVSLRGEVADLLVFDFSRVNMLLVELYGYHLYHNDRTHLDKFVLDNALDHSKFILPMKSH